MTLKQQFPADENEVIELVRNIIKKVNRTLV